jgi:histidinol-phosphate aminotransferase
MKGYSAPLEGRAELIRYDFNECVIAPSQKVADALHKFISSGRINTYPDGYSRLHEKIAQYLEVDKSQVRVTNGADGAIKVISFATVENGDKVIIPSPSFGMFYIPTGVQGANVVKPEYKENMEFPLDEVLETIDDKTKMTIVCNPNNPTGTLVQPSDIEKILDSAKGTAVLVDEVYSEFTGVSVIDMIPKYDNLFVIRSFSKAWALAGARIGYIISQPKNIEELNKVASPYNVNQLAVEAATAALDDASYMENYVKEVMDRSKPALIKHLKMKGIKYHEGSANFLLIELSDPQTVYQKLKDEYGILVRPQKGPLSKMIRVSVGTEKDTEIFIKAFDNVLLSSKW